MRRAIPLILILNDQTDFPPNSYYKSIFYLNFVMFSKTKKKQKQKKTNKNKNRWKKKKKIGNENEKRGHGIF